jgi:hypothetical protein
MTRTGGICDAVSVDLTLLSRKPQLRGYGICEIFETSDAALHCNSIYDYIAITSSLLPFWQNKYKG